METVTEILTLFSSWAVSLTTILALLASICKPLREHIKKRFPSKTQAILEKVDGVQKDIRCIKADVAEMQEKQRQLAEKNDSNERDRLRETIFRFGNYARKGSKITSEEFRHLQEVFTKYQSLGGNGIAKAEFEFIREYYNNNAGKWI